jgi:DNA-binding NtrC family response regulator
MSKKIFIVDDEVDMLDSLQKILSQRGDLNIAATYDPAEALERVGQEKFDLIITDLKIGEISGIQILKAALGKYPDTKVVVISGYGTIEASVEAMQEGAFDFLEKPFASKKLFDVLDQAFQVPTQADLAITTDPVQETAFEGFIFKSDQMMQVITLVKKVSVGDVNILISGESGTGKELIARAIHNLSKRRINPFIPVNCGALPENLFESELFGHERGAFTGAVKTKPGLLEFANSGTFFFDEIGELSLQLQVKLLRMLEDRQIRRVGGHKEIDIDIRVIAATNKDLAEHVKDGKFREDLYYRMNTIQIQVPPLRERIDDIPPLANHFLNELSAKNNRPVQRFSSEAEQALRQYSWPGNVRELQNMISRAYYLCSSRVIQKADLPLPDTGKKIALEDHMFDMAYKEAKDYVLERFEVEYLTYQLRKNDGNISRTAETCGIDRRSIHRLINKYKLVVH